MANGGEQGLEWTQRIHNGEDWKTITYYTQYWEKKQKG